MALPKTYLNFTTSLASGITSTASSLTLARSTDDDGTTLSGSYILTIDEGTNSEEHMLVSLSGAAGTITTRGLSRVDATTNVAGNQKSHSRGASVKLTNAPLIKVINRLNGDEAFDSVDLTGIQSVAGLATPTVGETTKAANVDYVNSAVVAGGVDASTSVKGITKLSTAPASATNPIAVGDNDPRVPTTDENDALAGTSGSPSSSNKYVTNDDTSASSSANKVIRANASGDIADEFLNLTTAGDIVYTDGTDLTRLPIGTAGQILAVNSGATAPEWVGPSGTALDESWYTYTMMGMTTMWTTDAGTPSFSVNKTQLTGTANEAVSIRLEGPDDNGGRLWNDTQEVVLQTQVYIATGPGSGESFGFGFATAAASVTGEDTGTQVIFQFTDAGAGDLLFARVADGATGAESQITGITLGQWNTYRIHWRPGTDARFYVNGTLEATLSSNIPSNTNNMFVRFGIDATGNDMIFGPVIISQQQ